MDKLNKVKTLILLGEKCKKIRLQAELNQEEFAKICGYKQRMISEFENGRSDNLIIYLNYMELKKELLKKENSKNLD